MKKLFFLLGLIIVFLFLNPLSVFGEVNYPEHTGYVNDFADILPADFEQKLEADLRDYEAKTTNEIAVVTVSSLEGLSIEDYAMGLAEKWGVGKEGKDNGAIILVAHNDRAVRIEVGYGLEPVLTDSEAGMIIEEEIIPFFKNGDYVSGIDAGVQKIIKTIGFLTPEEIQQQAKEEGEKESKIIWLICIAFGLAFFVAIVLVISYFKDRISAKRKEKDRCKNLQMRLGPEISQLSKERDDLLAKLFSTAEDFSKRYKIRSSEILFVVSRAKLFSLSCQNLLEKAENDLEENPDSTKESLDMVRGIIDEINSLNSGLVLNFDEMPRKNKEEIERIKEYLKTISAKVQSARRTMGELMKDAPAEVWQNAENDLEKIPFLKEDISDHIEKIGVLNSVNFQKFEEAQSRLAFVNNQVESIEAIINAPARLQRDFYRAKNKVPGLKKSLEGALKKAEEKTRDSDAGNESKRLLSQAQEKREKAKKAEDSNAVNWIILAALFGEALVLAEDSSREAENSVVSAYRRRSDDETYRSSSSYHSGSGYSSLGGFGGGGFGGGHFGGGGASGHW